MSRSGRFILIGILAVAALLLLRSVAMAFYFTPRSDLSSAITADRDRLSNIRTAAERHIALREGLQALADRTLGSTREQVEAALRARLNRIVEEVGLASPTVSTGSVSSKESPMKRADLSRNPFRDELDFVEVNATISGEGSLEQSIAVVDRVEQEPWIKRINSVSVDPRDGGERFSITVRLTTLYLPAVPPDPEGAAAALAQAYDGSGVASLRGLIDSNPFRVPPPPAVAEQPAQPEQPRERQRPPAYDYAQWAITMITHSSRGREVWILNRNTNESRALAAGDVVKDLEFVAATDDAAEFRLGEERFTIDIGATLAERRKIEE